MNIKRYTLYASVFLMGIFGAQAQVTDYSTLPNSPAYESAAEPLRSAPPSEYKFSDAKLADVLGLLAEEAGISFFSLPEGTEAGDRIVTFTINSSPFLALETLTKANAISLIFENGVWYLRPANDTHLIGRVYQIQYNTREMVSAGNSGAGLGSVGGGGGGGSTGGTSGGGGGGIDLQGSTASFEVEPSQLLEDIRELLDIPAGVNAIFAGSTSVDALAAGQGGASSILVPTGAGGIRSEEDDTAQSNAKVIWNSDSNTLYVVATRQQHQWIEGYLAASDKPQDQIALEVKFFETSRDPRIEFGLDWTDTLGDGYSVSLEGDGSIGEGLANPINLQRVGDYALPTTAILSFEDLNLRLRALVQDSETKSISYPRMLTTNNREVMLRSVVNQPVLSASSSTSLGAGATTTQSVSYLPIGTVLNILPKRMGNGKIQLNVALTISSIIGQEIIQGNPYPIASSRVYNAPVEVDPGYTVAIGGLDEANWSNTESGIPALRKLPVLGYAFKSRSGVRGRSSLIIMITPWVVDSRKGGLPDKPQAVERLKPGMPEPSVIRGDGTLVNGLGDLDDMILSLDKDCDVLEVKVDELSVEEEDRVRMQHLLTSVKETRAKLAQWSEGAPYAEELYSYDNALKAMQYRLERMLGRARWMMY